MISLLILRIPRGSNIIYSFVVVLDVDLNRLLSRGSLCFCFLVETGIIFLLLSKVHLYVQNLGDMYMPKMDLINRQ